MEHVVLIIFCSAFLLHRAFFRRTIPAKMRVSYAESFSRFKKWMYQIGNVTKFDSDIGRGWSVQLQPGLIFVLSSKGNGAFFVQLMRTLPVLQQDHKHGLPWVQCTRVKRALNDAFPCIKHHITIDEARWNKVGYFHISIYDDGQEKAISLLFDLYYHTCFPPWHPQRIRNPTNFGKRVVHIYFHVDKSGEKVTVSSKLHQEGKCIVLMTPLDFEKKMFDLVRFKYPTIDASILNQSWRAHIMIMEDVKTLMNIFGSVLIPLKTKQNRGSNHPSKPKIFKRPATFEL